MFKISKKSLNDMEPQIDIRITKYLKSKFIIFLTFFTDYNHDEDKDYSGIIEITFDLNNYLEK